MMMTIDNFVSDPDAVRVSCLQAGIGTWRPNKGEVGSSIYDGMGFWGHHAVMVKALSQAMGRPVYPNAMFFRVTNLDTEAAYVHSDRQSGDYSCIAYLSRHEDVSGTGFYQHRETGLKVMPPFSDLVQVPEFFKKLKKQMVEGSADDWELVNFIDGKYNRAVVFDAPKFHARRPKNGFGSTPEDGRLVWACHFFM